jgi:acetyl-CoA acetyltransferase
LSTTAAAIAGVGTTPFGRLPPHDDASLGAWALREALSDCGLTAADIDGLIVSRIGDVQRFAELVGLRPAFATSLLGQGRNTGPAIAMAVALVQAKIARTVALVYGNSSVTGGAKYGGTDGAFGSGGDDFWFPWGMTSIGAFHALLYQRYAARYGTRPEDLAEVPLTFRRHAELNPQAVMRKPISRADYLGARFIVEPLRLLDYCIVCDGGAAMVVTSRDRAADLKKPVIEVSGTGLATAFDDGGFPPEDFWCGAMRNAAGKLYAATGVSPKDVDALMIYDNFSPCVLYQLEGFGFCERGEAAQWIRGGRLGLGGRYPTNTSGGHLSEAYMQGWNLNIEAVRQLRGECGARQAGRPRRVQYMNAAPMFGTVLYSRVD